MFAPSFRFIIAVMFAALLVGCATITATFSASKQDVEVNFPTPVLEFPTPIYEGPELAVEELPVPLFELHQQADVKLTQSEIRCMALNIYHEARGESFAGRVAVGYVVLNRMASPLFSARTACGVIYQKNQFHWVHLKKDHTPRDREAYAEAEEIALLVMQRMVDNPIDNSLFFRGGAWKNRAYNQRWVATLGNHAFYAMR